MLHSNYSAGKFDRELGLMLGLMSRGLCLGLGLECRVLVLWLELGYLA